MAIDRIYKELSSRVAHFVIEEPAMLETLLIFFVISSGVYWAPQVLLTTSGSEHLTELKARRKTAIHRIFFVFQIVYLATTIWVASWLDAAQGRAPTRRPLGHACNEGLPCHAAE